MLCDNYMSYRATANDCLDSSYFKEKPLRTYRLVSGLSLTHFSELDAVCDCVSLCSLWTRADAHVSSPQKQAGRLCDRKPVQKKQSVTSQMCFTLWRDFLYAKILYTVQFRLADTRYGVYKY